MLDRSRPPRILTTERLYIPAFELIHLDNGIPVYVINLGTQDVLKLDVVYHAGRPFEKQKMAARATSRMLREGSRWHSSAEIAEFTDYYGAGISIPYQMDTSNIYLHCLGKHFDSLLPLFRDVLHEPAFQQEELQSFVQNSQQRLQVDLTKNDVVAYRNITEAIFGTVHPYGYNSDEAIYGALRREHLIEHHRRLYHPDNCMLFISGKVTGPLLQQLNRNLGQIPRRGKVATARLPEPRQQPQQWHEERPGTVQTAIRIGRRLFARSHPDYAGMYVLNTLLGGYFGSRLMTNIREDKGYTYNIHSSLDCMRYDGGIYIGSEVSHEYVDATLREIYQEIAILRQEPVPAAELDMVKNYIIGNSLTMLDGPFNVAELLRTLVSEGLQASDFERAVEEIRAISSDQLQDLAQKYLRREDLWELTVGQRNAV